MQQMFSTMKVNQPSQGTDFFAEEPKKDTPSPPPPPPAPVAPSFDMNFGGTNQNNFATGFGFGMDPSAINSKAFATSVPTGKGNSIDFLNAQDPAAFAKKPTENKPA